MVIIFFFYNGIVVNQPKIQYIRPVQFRHVHDEVLIGIIDGNNKEFKTLNTYISGHITIYLNGLKQRIGEQNDFVEVSGDTIAFEQAPLPGDIIVADYLIRE